MTTLTDRPASALLVVDVQIGVMKDAHDRDGVIARIADLAARARAAGAPVIWVQHENEHLIRGEAPWRLASELSPLPEEPVIAKHYGDAFEETELEACLAARGVGRLIVCGAQTDACIRSTLHGALVRGYDVILVRDAHTTEDLSAWGAPPPEQVIVHTNLYWAHETAPGRTAGAAPASEVTFGVSARPAG